MRDIEERLRREQRDAARLRGELTAARERIRALEGGLAALRQLPEFGQDDLVRAYERGLAAGRAEPRVVFSADPIALPATVGAMPGSPPSVFTVSVPVPGTAGA